MPLKAAFRSSRGSEHARRFWLVGVHAEGISGWAEAVAGDAPLYTEETHTTVHHILVDHVLPRLFAQPISSPDAVSSRLADVRGNPMAKASVEMAIWDWFARRKATPLYRMLGGRRADIPVGVAIGIQPSVQELVAVAREYWAQGYRRLKVKIQPGMDIAPLAALREALPDAPIMADANSAYTLADLSLFRELDQLDLMMVEQPLAADDLLDHAYLQDRITTPVCLDESIRSVRHAQQALMIGACRVINIKPGRVGGFREARAIHDEARTIGVPVWCGGMLESGIGRAANLHLSSLPGFSLPGDTSASARYYAEDLINPGFVLTNHGTLTIPEGPGLGVEPDPDRLSHYRISREWIRAPKT